MYGGRRAFCTHVVASLARKRSLMTPGPAGTQPSFWSRSQPVQSCWPPVPPSSEPQADRKKKKKKKVCQRKLLQSLLGLLCCSSFFWTLWLLEWVPFSIESFHCISYLHCHHLYVGCFESVNQIRPERAPHSFLGCRVPGSALGAGQWEELSPPWQGHVSSTRPLWAAIVRVELKSPGP